MHPAGARSLLYGSALGVGGVVLLGSFALRYMDVSSPADFRQRMQDWAVPYAHSVKASLLPFKDSMRVSTPCSLGLACKRYMLKQPAILYGPYVALHQRPSFVTVRQTRRCAQKLVAPEAVRTTVSDACMRSLVWPQS